jgi:hypothetical protein
MQTFYYKAKVFNPTTKETKFYYYMIKADNKLQFLNLLDIYNKTAMITKEIHYIYASTTKDEYDRSK